MITLEETALRLGIATLVGVLLGLDRELRGFPAGIRTHGLVALSSAVIMVSALKLYQDFGPGGEEHMDPLRVVQGLAQAIGFIAAGVIFTSPRGGVHNMTSAANIWLAASLGIAAGAAQYGIVSIALAFGIILLVLVRIAERFLPGSDKAGED